MASFIVEFLRNDERDGELQPMTMLVMAGYAIPAGSVVESSSDSLENLIM